MIFKDTEYTLYALMLLNSKSHETTKNVKNRKGNANFTMNRCCCCGARDVLEIPQMQFSVTASFIDSKANRRNSRRTRSKQ